MNDVIANVISVTSVRLVLKELLATYLLEKEENQRDNNADGIEYWDSACQTIEDVAVAIHISLVVEADEG